MHIKHKQNDSHRYTKKIYIYKHIVLINKTIFKIHVNWIKKKKLIKFNNIFILKNNDIIY